jgi:hypothetical protein
MPGQNYPLLLLSQAAIAERNSLPSGRGAIHFPSPDRQGQRLAPQLAVLPRAIAEKTLRLQQGSPVENPDMVLVLEVAGTIEDFANAVRKIQGFDWLLEWAREQLDPDEDFYVEDRDGAHRAYVSRIFLVGTNQQALGQLLGLWQNYQRNPQAKFERGLARFKKLFEQLRAIRFWSIADRVDAEIRSYWQDRIDEGLQEIRFEIEAWCYDSVAKNESTRAEIDTLIQRLSGRVLRRSLISEIRYHGFLVELPAAAVQDILAGDMPALVASDRIMFFRPKSQSIADVSDSNEVTTQESIDGEATEAPLVALLDGLPLSNHVLLSGHLSIDDPDNWETTYEAKDRMHGTAMASLIVHGELDESAAPIRRKLYVRPILRPDTTDSFNQRRRERTPDDELLIDLVHRAVKRIAHSDGVQSAVAPTVRVINLSVGLDSHVFIREMSPWARLIDWLAFRYSVLFIVSAGNDHRDLVLQTGDSTLSSLTADQRAATAFTALTAESVDRRMISPGESINALTVGALHSDYATFPTVADRFDLFEERGVSPISRIGLGYRRSIKPDILMPGGRVLYRERLLGRGDGSTVEVVRATAAPGQRTASPPLQGGANNETLYNRGTSNAAALASRAAIRIFDSIESLRAQRPDAPTSRFDAVLLKGLLVHGAEWGGLSSKLLAQRPDFDQIEEHVKRRAIQKDFVTRWLGYGPANTERVIGCTDERATLLGVGELSAEQALEFTVPLPPGLASRRVWRRLTVTMAWISPINPSHQTYRGAKLWVTPPQDQLRVKRTCAHERTVLRGTVQHEILEGEDAVAFSDGDSFRCKVNCAADAGKLTGKVPFALCVSLEVAVNSGISIYQEIRDRIAPTVAIRPN